MPRGAPRLRTSDGKLNQLAQRAGLRRRDLRIGQDELCGRIAQLTNGGWNPTWRDIQRIECGLRIVSDVELLVLAQALECSPCWVLLGEED